VLKRYRKNANDIPPYLLNLAIIFLFPYLNGMKKILIMLIQEPIYLKKNVKGAFINYWRKMKLSLPASILRKMN